MAVYVESSRWRPSNYVANDVREKGTTVGKKCGVCGCNIRGDNHENGSHHINRVKSSSK